MAVGTGILGLVVGEPRLVFGGFFSAAAMLLVGVLAEDHGVADRGYVESGVTSRQEPAGALRLSQVLRYPDIAEAAATGPRVWQPSPGRRARPAKPARLFESVLIRAGDGRFVVALEEGLDPYVDLDVDEYRDPLLQALSSHFTVKSVSRPERGIYVGEFHEDIRATAIAPVVTRALVAGHLATVRTG